MTLNQLSPGSLTSSPPASRPCLSLASNTDLSWAVSLFCREPRSRKTSVSVPSFADLKGKSVTRQSWNQFQGSLLVLTDIWWWWRTAFPRFLRRSSRRRRQASQRAPLTPMIAASQFPFCTTWRMLHSDKFYKFIRVPTAWKFGGSLKVDKFLWPWSPEGEDDAGVVHGSRAGFVAGGRSHFWILVPRPLVVVTVIVVILVGIGEGVRVWN